MENASVKKQDYVCHVCGNEGFRECLVTCFSCGFRQHMYCMRELNMEVPKDWQCDYCQIKTQALLATSVERLPVPAEVENLPEEGQVPDEEHQTETSHNGDFMSRYSSVFGKYAVHLKKFTDCIPQLEKDAQELSSLEDEAGIANTLYLNVPQFAEKAMRGWTDVVKSNPYLKATTLKLLGPSSDTTSEASIIPQPQIETVEAATEVTQGAEEAPIIPLPQIETVEAATEVAQGAEEAPIIPLPQKNTSSEAAQGANDGTSSGESNASLQGTWEATNVLQSDVPIYRKIRRRNFVNTLRSPFLKGQEKDKSTLKDGERKSFLRLLDDKLVESITFFDDGDMLIARDSFLTMRMGKEVECVIVDVWAKMLNTFSKTNPKRGVRKIYFTTALSTLKFSVKDYTTILRNELLSFNILDSDMEHAELIFFPILAHRHYYVICVNKNTRQLEIIDNIPLQHDLTVEDKYTTLPQIRMGVDVFLRRYGIKLSEYPTRLLLMSCQNAKNIIDSGIYCMHHLHTYQGNPDDFDCGIPKISCNSMIEKLRIRMTLSILLSEPHKNRNYLLSLVKDLLCKANTDSWKTY